MKLKFEVIKETKPEDSNAELALMKVTDPEDENDKGTYEVIIVTDSRYELASHLHSLDEALKIYSNEEDKFLKEYHGAMY